MRKPLITGTALLLVAFGLTPLLPSTTVHGTGASLSAVAQPSWQTNASVNTIAIAKGKVYAGGRFTAVRPPGAAPGTRQVTRTYLAAFNQSTGALDTSFNHTLNGLVHSIAAYHTGSRIFVAGDFTLVDGQVRNRIAAFDTATGRLVPDWKPSVNCCRVKTLATYQNVVYLGGSFAAVNGEPRPRLAAVAASNGALLGWSPKPDADVYAIDVADNGSKVYAGGTFMAVNGAYRRRIAAIAPYPDKGETLYPFPAGSAIPLPPPVGCRSVVKDIDTYSNQVYVANGGDGGGCFDGTFAADVASGNLIWKNNCLGATEAIKAVGGWLYKGSHAHDCSQDGGFPEGYGNRYLLVQYLSNGRLGPWFPNTNSGPPTAVGPLAMAAGGYDLWVGGDFTKVYGFGQQGLTHFTNAAPGARPFKPGTPSVTSPAAGQATVSFQTTVDYDDYGIAYRLVRGNTIVKSWYTASSFWSRPTLTHTETGLTSGATVSYRVQAYDGRSAVWSDWSTPVRVR